MENNIFAAFSFSGGPARKEALGSGGANLPKVVEKKRGNHNNASGFSTEVGGHPTPAAAAHALFSKSRNGKVKHENASDCGSSCSLDVSSEMVLFKDGENSRHAKARSQNYQFVAKNEKKETVEVEEVNALPQEMYEIQVKEENASQQLKEESTVQQVKEENQVIVESHSMVYEKRLPQGNCGREEEEFCEEIEDFGDGGGELRFRSADSNSLEVKRLKLKRQNTKLTKGSRFGSSQFSSPPSNWGEALQSIRCPSILSFCLSPCALFVTTVIGMD
ncbi:unnamed protein product [Calypogeia fissa]